VNDKQKKNVSPEENRLTEKVLKRMLNTPALKKKKADKKKKPA